MDSVRCIACACVYWVDDLDGLDAEMCPQRYLSPHTEEFKALVAQGLDDMNLPDINRPAPDQHLTAIRQARENHGL